MSRNGMHFTIFFDLRDALVHRLAADSTTDASGCAGASLDRRCGG